METTVRCIVCDFGAALCSGSAAGLLANEHQYLVSFLLYMMWLLVPACAPLLYQFMHCERQLLVPVTC